MQCSIDELLSCALRGPHVSIVYEEASVPVRQCTKRYVNSQRVSKTKLVVKAVFKICVI